MKGDLATGQKQALLLRGGALLRGRFALRRFCLGASLGLCLFALLALCLERLLHFALRERVGLLGIEVVR